MSGTRPLPADLAAHVLCHPDAVPRLSASEWDRLLRQARKADVLGRIAARVLRDELLDSLPPGPRGHLQAALTVTSAQQAEVRREIAQLAPLLYAMGLPLVLLKGAAYLVAGRSAAQGRLFSDVDILVPRGRLAEVEAALMTCGWASTHHSPYDQRYYREWMHEIPPMRHIRRGTTLDVHHAILPLTARAKPDSALLLKAAMAVPEDPRVQTLCPEDMVLHSMTHLFHNEELSHGLRDLSDIDLLLREFGADARFWDRLAERAALLQLGRPLYYGLRCARMRMGTPVPPGAVARAQAFAPAWPSLMDAVWDRGLATHHSTAARSGQRGALFAAYVRGHWLKMPPLMLARHLLVKASRAEASSPEAP